MSEFTEYKGAVPDTATSAQGTLGLFHQQLQFLKLADLATAAFGLVNRFRQSCSRRFAALAYCLAAYVAPSALPLRFK